MARKHPRNEEPLVRLFNALAKQAKVKHRKALVVNNPTDGVADEPGYVPLARGDQTNRRLILNTGSPAYVRATPAMNRAGMAPLGSTDKKYQEFTMAHELGHVAQGQYVPDRAASDRYLDATLGTKGRTPYWMQGNMQGRAETRRVGPDALIQRDRLGMPWRGPGTTHSSPGEQYATDFAGALGRGEGSGMHPVHPDVLKKLMRMKLLPSRRPRRSGGDGGFLSFLGL